MDWKSLFNDLPDVSGVLLAAIGAAVMFAPEWIKRLETRRSTRYLLASVCLTLGVAGMFSAHLQRKERDKTQGDLKTQVGNLNKKMEIVTNQNNQILAQLALTGPSGKPPSEGGEVKPPVRPPIKPPAKQPTLTTEELQRRKSITAALRNEYILSHDGITPAMMSGIELPSEDWINQRLEQLKQSWRVRLSPDRTSYSFIEIGSN